MATCEHDPTDADASLVTSTQSTKRQHTRPCCQSIDSAREPGRNIEGEQCTQHTNQGFQQPGIIMNPLFSVPQYPIISISTYLQFPYIATYSLTHKIYVLLSFFLHLHHLEPNYCNRSPSCNSLWSITCSPAMFYTPHTAPRMSFFIQMLISKHHPPLQEIRFGQGKTRWT